MPETTKVVPQNLYAVTLGARDIKRIRDFYEAWGWEALPYSSEEYAAFSAGGPVVGFFVKDKLAAEAAPGESVAEGGWNGVTLAVNLAAREEVDACWRSAVSAGAKAIGEPEDRPWGGRSGYVADPEGNRWEIAWVPPMTGG